VQWCYLQQITQKKSSGWGIVYVSYVHLLILIILSAVKGF